MLNSSVFHKSCQTVNLSEKIHDNPTTHFSYSGVLVVHVVVHLKILGELTAPGSLVRTFGQVVYHLSPVAVRD